MESIETEALHILANIEDDNSQYESQRFKPNFFQKRYKSTCQQRRPQTVNTDCKKQRNFVIDAHENKREELKKQLRILEELNHQQVPNSNNIRTKCITTESVFCIAPLLMSSHSNAFPSQPIKKLNPQKRLATPKARTRQNQNSPFIAKIQDMIRLDIKKKFESRQRSKMDKINHFLKMTAYSRRMINVPIILQKLEEKRLRQTLTKILS